MQAQTPTPITRLQDLRERWALVKAKFAALYVQNRDVALWLSAMAAMALAVLLLATWWPAERGIEQGQAPTHAAAPAADHTAAIAELQAKVDYLLTLAAHHPPADTPAPRASAPWVRPSPKPTPAPQPLPQAAQASPSAPHPAPITRQSLDQFRASLRTTQE